MSPHLSSARQRQLLQRWRNSRVLFVASSVFPPGQHGRGGLFHSLLVLHLGVGDIAERVPHHRPGRLPHLVPDPGKLDAGDDRVVEVILGGNSIDFKNGPKMSPKGFLKRMCWICINCLNASSKLAHKLPQKIALSAKSLLNCQPDYHRPRRRSFPRASETSALESSSFWESFSLSWPSSGCSPPADP